MIFLPSHILTPRGETGEPESFRVRAGSNSAQLAAGSARIAERDVCLEPPDSWDG